VASTTREMEMATTEVTVATDILCTFTRQKLHHI